MPLRLLLLNMILLNTLLITRAIRIYSSLALSIPSILMNLRLVKAYKAMPLSSIAWRLTRRLQYNIQLQSLLQSLNFYLCLLLVLRCRSEYVSFKASRWPWIVHLLSSMITSRLWVLLLSLKTGFIWKSSMLIYISSRFDKK
jgi:hypothetical protein